MDVQRYISSGFIESYVLGLLSEQEVRELEQLMRQYPEIKGSVEAYQQTMESYAQLHAVPPPAFLKDQIMAAIERADEETAPAPANGEKEAPLVVSLNNIPRRIRWWQYAAAASILLLMTSLVLNMVFFNKYQDYKQRYSDLLVAQNTVVAKNQVYETKLQQYERDLEIMRNPSMKQVILPGLKDHPGLMASVYWNPHSKDLYLAVNNLPEPPSDKQYQLWAIVNGKPVDAGVFDMGAAAKTLQKMKAIDKAQAFAITLEKKGGNPTPQGTMYVLGKV